MNGFFANLATLEKTFQVIFLLLCFFLTTNQARLLKTRFIDLLICYVFVSDLVYMNSLALGKISRINQNHLEQLFV